MTGCLVRQGVPLAYELVGRGDPPLLFIHGNSCDHGFFAPQLAHFSGRHAVLAPDLRGHGQSGAPEQSYTMAGWADDLAWLAGELGLARVVAAGHSMGGMIALELAVAHPELVAGLVIMDSTILSDRHRREVYLPPIVAGLRGPDHLATFRGFFDPLFGPWFDPSEKERLLAHMARTPRHVMVEAFEQLRVWDGRELLKRLACPALYVAGGAGWRHQPAELAAACPGLATAQVALAGHFVTTEAAAQTNAILDRFLARLA